MLTRVVPGYSKHLMGAQLKLVASQSWIEQILSDHEEVRNGDGTQAKEIVVLQDLVWALPIPIPGIGFKTNLLCQPLSLYLKNLFVVRFFRVELCIQSDNTNIGSNHSTSI